MKSIEYIPRDIPEGFVIEDRVIPGEPFQGLFKITQVGHIRGIRNRHGRAKAWRARSIFFDKRKGHWVYYHWMETGERRKVITVASLVLLTFVGPRPKGKEIYYLDRDKGNHCLWNLVYLTKEEAAARGFRPTMEEFHRIGQQGIKDKIAKFGRKTPGRKPRVHNPRRLTPEEVNEVISEYEAGRKLPAIWKERFASRMAKSNFQSKIYTTRRERIKHG